MSRQFFGRWFWFMAVVFIWPIWGGCEQVVPQEQFYEMKVPQQKLRQVETLDLKDTQNHDKSDVNNIRDVNGIIDINSIEVKDVNKVSQKELSITLEDCRVLALENNLGLKVELINPAISAQRVSAEEAKFEAAFFSNIDFSKTDRPAATSLGLAGSQVDSTSVDMGVKVPLRTGGTVTFDVADNRAKTNFTGATFNPAYSSTASLSISQPLLRNAGKRVNTHSIRILEYERLITNARTKLEVIRVLAGAERVYWRLYAARRELEVRRQQYDLAQAQLSQARRFVDVGEMAPVEIVRAEAGVAERLEGIIVAENSLRDRERELKRVLNKPGLSMQATTALVPATEPDPIHYELARSKMVSTAFDNRMEMLELELQIAEDVSTVDYLRNQALPLASVDYTYNINGLGPTRSDSYDLLYDKKFEDHRVGLQLLVPLGNEAAKSRLREAFYLRKQRLATRDDRKSLIEVEVLNAIDHLESNWQRILASRQNSILSGILYEAEKHQFELGLRTSTDVLDAQTKFADAQRAEILALTEYQIAQVDLAFATGTLLGAAKVSWEPILPTLPAAPKTGPANR